MPIVLHVGSETPPWLPQPAWQTEQLKIPIWKRPAWLWAITSYVWKSLTPEEQLEFENIRRQALDHWRRHEELNPAHLPNSDGPIHDIQEVLNSL